MDRIVQLFKCEAEKGGALAQVDLRFILYFGQGLPLNYKEALRWFHKAAKQGNTKAQFDLGCMNRKGQSVSQNYKESYSRSTRP